MLKLYLISIACCAVSLASVAQYYYYNDRYYHSPVLLEAGISLSALNCLTDLGGNSGPGRSFLKDLNLQKTHPGVGIYASTLFQKVLFIQLRAGVGRISASDDVLKGEVSEARLRYQRNLHFRSRIRELLLTAGLFPRSLFDDDPLLSPFLSVGIGIFSFNPQARHGETWYDLHALHTEGQGFLQYPSRQPYRLTQLNFPVAVGLRYELSAVCVARIECTYRFLTTDYLDDVSTTHIQPGDFALQVDFREALIARTLSDRTNEIIPGYSSAAGQIRGNPRNRDAYLSLDFSVGFVLNRKRR